MSGGFLAVQARRSKEKKKSMDLEDAFKAADVNKDGKLSVDEWLDVLTKAGQGSTRYVPPKKHTIKLKRKGFFFKYNNYPAM
jgi:hypothetical protein